MRYIRVTVLLVLVLLVGVLHAQDKEKPKPYKGRLPTGWSKILKLDKNQSDKIRGIDVKAREEIDKLAEQIRQVRRKAMADQLALLTPEQRKTLREALVGKDEGTKPKDGSKPKPSDKGKDGGKEK
jgi:Spy/CpxP family protein refolding chaperone